MRYEIDIFYYLNIYKRHWKRMAFLIAVAVCITAMVESVKPVTYRATLIALSSKESTQAGSLGKFLGFAMPASSDEVIFSMLKSRRMREDIEEHFKLKDRPKFWWTLNTYIVTGGYAIEVTGSDPELTRDIANFTAKNVDQISTDINFGAEKGMVKVLDPAIKGSPIRRAISKKVIASGLFVFLAYTLFIFFREYFSNLKRSKNRKKENNEKIY